MNEKTVKMVDGINFNWKTSIREAAKPLLNDGTVQYEYLNSMIDIVEKEGPYINIGPQIALAHAEPSKYVNRVGMSLLKTRKPVALTSKDHMINIWFVMATIGSDSYLQSIQELTKLLSDSVKVGKLICADDTSDILNLIKSID
ncbi:PTS sugar transporter subunit IIA [Oenococcus oeni]